MLGTNVGREVRTELVRLGIPNGQVRWNMRVTDNGHGHHLTAVRRKQVGETG
jgi:hypothetical protein